MTRKGLGKKISLTRIKNFPDVKTIKKLQREKKDKLCMSNMFPTILIHKQNFVAAHNMQIGDSQRRRHGKSI